MPTAINYPVRPDVTLAETAKDKIGGGALILIWAIAMLLSYATPRPDPADAYSLEFIVAY